MIGSTISHYRILEELGRGGMGVVYKGHDTQLDRFVAIKFLPRQVSARVRERHRFTTEARAAAGLNHPNIATIYAIEEAEDEMFIVMEYVEGEELMERIARGPLSIEKVVNIATQIAEGLQAAHKKEVVHRDIKSSNIMLTETGRVKIMDFGLAKVRGGAQLTKAGTTVGTAAYMSPEQARGDAVDHHTDIWSFGVVLYEMLTGKLPFRSDYDQAMIYSILNQDPEPISDLRSDLPPELEAVMRKALAKKPAERHMNMSEVIADLRNVSSGTRSAPGSGKQSPPDAKPSVAVLPFANMSADAEQEYFCDGITEEIINALTRVGDLHVAARTSSFYFRGKNVDVREIGEKLNVAHLLEGSVRKSGNRLRITAQLINIANGYHLWSERFDRTIDDVFAIQDEIALTIAKRLKVKFSGGEEVNLVKRYTDNLAAHNLYLQGRYFVNKGVYQDVQKAISYFEQAINADPKYALAYARLADAYVILTHYVLEPPRETFTKAKVAATKALELDDSLAEAHAAMSSLAHLYEWDWQRAEEGFRHAITLSPDNAYAHEQYARFLSEMGRPQKAMAEIEKALALDPLSLWVRFEASQIYHRAGEDEKSSAQVEQVLAMDFGFMPMHVELAWRHMSQGKPEEAVAEWLIVLQIKFPDSVARVRKCYEESGPDGFYRGWLRYLQDRQAPQYVLDEFVWPYIGLGQNKEAMDHLYHNYEEKSPYMPMLLTLPAYDPLRADPRFQELLKKMNFPV